MPRLAQEAGQTGAVLKKSGARAPTTFAGSLRRGLSGAGAALATTDGRWAVVSTSLTALVAGALAWMAVGMMPGARPMVSPGRSSLPYALFMKLIRASEPAHTNDNSDNANPDPGVENRTITLDA